MSNINKNSIEKVINKHFNTLEDKTNKISKELVIIEIENLPSKRDSRFSPIVQEWYNEHKYNVKEYLKGNLKEFSSAESDKFKVVILNNFRLLYIKKDNPNHPVPVGKWMDWWESDHRAEFGVTEEQYKNLSIKERASLESKLQLKLWISKEYYNNYAEFYLPQEYDKWWWDEDGATKKMRDFDYGNEYWKQKLQKRKSQLTGEDIFDITTTGISYYNSMIQIGHIVGKYKDNPLEYFKNNKGIIFEIERMSPEEYLTRVYTIHMNNRILENIEIDTIEDYLLDHIDFENVKKYKERTLEGSKMPMIVLDYKRNEQEGRHRAVVAQQLEVKEIPVLVVRPYEE